MMKKIIILLTLTVTLFAKDVCNLDVYFGNGVWNDKEDAEYSKGELKKFIQKHHPDRFSLVEEGETYEFKVAYNKEEGLLDDLLETFWQLHESGQIGDFYFGFITRILDAANILSHEEEDYRSKMAAIASHAAANTESMLQLYRNSSFSQNHDVLLLAHSQGNLFANEAFKLMTQEEKEKFQIVGIAVPPSYIATGDNYVTFTLDLVIRAVPGSLPANVSGFGHTFVNSYLDADNAEAAAEIDRYIKNGIGLLDKNACAEYEFFRWIGYICPKRNITELEVAIYGSKPSPDNPYIYVEEYVTSDSRSAIALIYDESTNKYICPLGEFDYRTSVSMYDKNGCSAYTFDDTSGGNHSLDFIADKTYENKLTCTVYNMSENVHEYLKALSK